MKSIALIFLSLLCIFKVCEFSEVNSEDNVHENQSQDNSMIDLFKPSSSLNYLSWCRNAPVIFSFSLIEDIMRRKQTFRDNEVPLVALYLYVVFKNFDSGMQSKVLNYLKGKNYFSFESFLADFCAKNGHFYWAFAVVQNDPIELTRCFSRAENKKAMMEFFKSNPELVVQYKQAFPKHCKYYERGNWFYPSYNWIEDCIKYDAPEDFYVDLLNVITNFGLSDASNFLIHNLFLSVEIPESEYPLFYEKIKKILNEHLRLSLEERSFIFYTLLNEIRFSENASSFYSITFKSEFEMFSIAMAALFGNKRELFFDICDSIPNSDRIIMKLFAEEYKRYPYESAKYLRPIFEIIERSTAFDGLYLPFIMRFYAINSAKENWVQRGPRDFEFVHIDYEFVAREDLIALGFSPIIRLRLSDNHSLKIEISKKIFSYMKVVDEVSVSNYLDYYVTRGKKDERLSASMELIKLLADSPNLLERFVSAGIKFDFYSYYNDEPLLFIRTLRDPFILLNNLNSEKIIKVFERIECKSVAEFYFEFESATEEELNYVNYVKWRFVFAYWIKSDQRALIRGIRSPVIKALLKIEFPEVI